ncbi:hypothetical protein HU200_048002 [Digitaria exilis]|uniref:Uncharacterized protein n=1 Tax=Digitaria exilis TaxID=1010633 RepID=A0A835AX90_9POAL|nr:hypothetical protein HU200_048002 [Digitaria exilis]
MERADDERPLLLLQPPQVESSQYTRDGSVDINGQPALKHRTGNWQACFLILGVEFSECMAFFAISKNLVTYLTTVLHESNVAAARNASAWVGACFFTPLFGGFIADTYLGKYWTIAVFIPVYFIVSSKHVKKLALNPLLPATLNALLFHQAMIVLMVSASLPIFTTSSDHGDNIHRVIVYLGLYLAAIGNGGVKPCTSTFGADQFDINDPAELVKKSSFFNWYYFLISISSLLSGTVIVWLQDNVGWAVSYVIPAVLMLICFPVFLTGLRIYRFRKMGVSPLKSIFQVVIAAVRKRHMKLPDDSSLLHETTSSPTYHKINHTSEFRFFDKAAIASVPSDNEFMIPESSWRLCTVTQVEELKMLLRIAPIWASFLIFFSVSAQMSSTLIEQGMFMDNRVGSFAIPPASMSIFGVFSSIVWVILYETVLVPLARHFTGKEKGFSQAQRLGIGQALSMLTMVCAALLEMRRLAIAEAKGLTDRNVPVPMSILWQVPLYLVHGAADVFGGIAMSEFFYDQSPETMKSLCAALGQLAIASGSYINSLMLSVVAVATTSDGATGWIPNNLNEGHLDYFYWMLAFLSFLNLSLFVHYSVRHRAKTSL